MRALEEATLAGQRVLVRIDADVPLNHHPEVAITDDYRLQKLLPTLFYLLNHRAKIILCGHLGRPDGKPDPRLSLKPVFLHLSALVNKPILFAPDPFGPPAKAKIAAMTEGEIIALENLRFWPGEGNNSRVFARQLAKLADIYVNDAFGSAHPAASTVAITEFLPSYAGLQLEAEVKTLTELLRHPARPVLAIIGGAKVTDKLPAIAGLLPLADRVVTGGRVATHFLASQDVDVKKSVLDPAMVKLAGKLFRRAKGKIILPADYVWHDDQIWDLGAQTVAQLTDQVKRAHTIIWSGVLGKVEEPEFASASRQLARQLANTAATTVVGGGDTVGFIQSLRLTSKYSFVSTGGSAMLELLSHQALAPLTALG